MEFGNDMNNQNENQKVIQNRNLGIVIATSVLTFLVTSLAFMGVKIFNPAYEISFDRNTVKAESIAKFNQAKELIKKEYYKEISDDKLLEGAIGGMAEALQDPYTVYYTKEQMKAFDEKSQGSYCGIGVTVRPDAHGILTVIDTFDTSPAKKVGIVGGDKIVKVDDVDVTTIKDEDTVINMIKGTEGSTVKIKIYRTSGEEYHDFSLERKVIRVENIKSEVLKDSMGYIKLQMFDKEISKDFSTHLNKLVASGIKGLIVDVRDNPGGNYREVVRICDTLLPKSLIVYTQDRAGKKSEEWSDEAALDKPIVILTNENSASASEILAGALKDNKKGTLVGTKTYGKGLVQTIQKFKDGSGMKYTVSSYYTPSDICIDKIGIEPDVKVEFNEKLKDKPVSQLKREEDIQLQKAVEILKEQIVK